LGVEAFDPWGYFPPHNLIVIKLFYSVLFKIIIRYLIKSMVGREGVVGEGGYG